jgi:hypothetical protein
LNAGIEQELVDSVVLIPFRHRAQECRPRSELLPVSIDPSLERRPALDQRLMRYLNDCANIAAFLLWPLVKRETGDKKPGFRIGEEIDDVALQRIVRNDASCSVSSCPSPGVTRRRKCRRAASCCVSVNLL